MNTKRKAAQELILETLKRQDPSGYNTQYYQDIFAKMQDSDFDRWMRTLQQDPNAKLVLLVPPMKVVIKPEHCFAAAKFLGLELLERVRMWDPLSKRYCLTNQKYYILRMAVRRLKQYGKDSISVPDSDKRLNPLTDQVVKPDKGSAISFPQAQMIAEKGLTKTLHELMTIRGGDLEAYARMKAEIADTGESTTAVSDGTAGVRSQITLRTLLNAMHLEVNLG